MINMELEQAIKVKIEDFLTGALVGRQVNLVDLQMTERFFNRQILKGQYKDEAMKQLGKAQQQIKECNDWLGVIKDEIEKREIKYISNEYFEKLK